MTRSDCDAIYEEGREAVAAALLRMDAAITALSSEIAALRAHVKSLEDRLAKDSHNSSKPPSSDPPFKKPKSLRPPTQQKSGGQAGHEGHTLRLSDHPDKVEDYAPAACAACGACLCGVGSFVAERRQVIDLPPLRLQVIEHRAHTIVCPTCQCRNQGAFPQAVTQPVQYGPRFSALCVYLQHYHLLPYDRLSRLFQDVFGAPVSEGTLWNLTTRCHGALSAVTAAIKKALIDSPVLHTDETSCRLGKRRFWMHTYCTDQLTHYAFHQKRGKIAMQEIGVLPDYKGVAVHDGWQDYFCFPCRHGLCGVHLLRDLIFVHEQFGACGTWAKGMIELFLEMKGAAQSAREQGLPAVPPAELATFLSRYDALLSQGYRHNPLSESPPSPPPLIAKGKKPKKPQTPFPLRLLDRFRDWKVCICRFVTDVRVPFDNNQSERDLRMIKVRQKISGCFRSEDGATAFCTIRGYLSTLAKQGIPLLQALVTVFQQKPIIPDLA